jgi:hypothetical protein
MALANSLREGIEKLLERESEKRVFSPFSPGQAIAGAKKTAFNSLQLRKTSVTVPDRAQSGPCVPAKRQPAAKNVANCNLY